MSACTGEYDYLFWLHICWEEQVKYRPAVKCVIHTPSTLAALKYTIRHPHGCFACGTHCRLARAEPVRPNQTPDLNSQVFETIKFSARLRCPQMSAAEINARVNEIIDSFGLSHVRNTIVGNAVMRGLSGGERRRVSIAVEVCMGTVCTRLISQGTVSDSVWVP
jgi:ABC-type dipeptide/oligopeptide/nickel transport system ATPase subunit